ncbi:uncharacterized protein [Bos mutus]|uniref:uncharacterized protein n=1 Tax=Bos mutus TaxID=72004 RepID=UPI0038B43E11
MEKDAPLLSAKFPGLFHAAPLPAPSPRPLSAFPLRQASTSHRQKKQLPSADPSPAASAALNRLPPPAARNLLLRSSPPPPPPPPPPPTTTTTPPPSTPQRSPLPPTQAWPRRRSELRPNYLVGPQSLRSGLGGAAVTSSSSPPTPKRRRRRLLGSLQLSAEPQHRSRRAPPPAPPSSLPARSNTLRELLCPPRLGLTVLVRGTGPPLPTRGSSHSPSPPLPSPPTPPPPPPRHCRARLPPAACDLLPIPSRDQEGECETSLGIPPPGSPPPPAFPTPPLW